jgi:hypothetical protein
MGAELVLNTLSALHGIDYRGKVHEEGIAHQLDDVAVMFRNGVLDDVVMHIQQPQHARFVGTHLPAEAHDVREHDGRQPPILRGYCAAGIFLHGYGLSGWRCLAVNRAG